MTLQIGITSIPVNPEAIDWVVEAERLGVDSVWVPEYWGYDALTPIGALAVVTDTIKPGTGIVQLGARTPALLAMSAMSLQMLSEGRFRLGLGTSGPQVIEGWHGVDFARPVQRTRETIEIIELVTLGETLIYDGDVYTLPRPGGQGRALRSAAPPVEVPIYLASLGPANLRLTGEVATGWIGNSFFCETADVFFGPIRTGAESAGRSLADIDLTVSAAANSPTTSKRQANDTRQASPSPFGAMGSESSNFYNNAFARQGFGDDVAEVQRLWRSGDKEAARARVPREIGLGTNLIGTPSEITRRLRQYRDCGVNTIRVDPIGDSPRDRLGGLGQLLNLVRDVNTETKTETETAANDTTEAIRWADGGGP